MPAKLEGKLGSLYITNETIASIAGVAAYDCYGIVGMSSKGVADSFNDMIRKESFVKGIKVSADGDRVVIQMHVVVEYGIRINVTAENIIHTVKYSVENMTGMTVEKVNIIVDGIRVDK